MTHDLVIRGGTVIDGSGLPSSTADIAVDDGIITSVGKITATAHREIDADGALVTPGFVDIHTHYDGQVTWDKTLQPSSLHGVTTAVMGNCGVGFAPVRDNDRDRLISLMEGVEDIPGVALNEGLSWNWNSLPEFLNAIEHPHDIDFAVQVPHGALRVHVMGERGARCEPATNEDIAEMSRLAAAGVEAGFVGFSTSRTLNHRTSSGDPTPTLTAARAELVGIASAIGRTGKGVLQMVGDFIDLDEEFAHLEAMLHASGRPLSFTLTQSPRNPNQWRDLVGRLERAHRSGLPIRAQVAPRAIGILLGLDCTMSPFDRSHTYQSLGALPVDERVVAMAHPDRREQIVSEIDEPRGRWFDWANLYPMGALPNYEPTPADSIAAIGARTGRSAAAVAYDHALSMGGSELFYCPFLNYAEGNLDVVREMLAHPLTVPGLGDGGAHVGTICDASFPTFLLTHWARDRADGRFSLEQVVKQQCSDVAETVGLTDRGRLQPGLRADINVIDHEALTIHRPQIRHDLPAGGRRVMQTASGYLHTFVAGTESYCDGQSTGALAGRLVRS